MPDHGAFVQQLLPTALKYAAQTSIPAFVLLGIAAHESNWGGAGGNMLFGIKGPGATMHTYEVEGGRDVPQDASFRTYASPDASFRDFVDLVSQGRYSGAWQALQETGDWRRFLRGLNRAGYATDPQWADKVANFATTTVAPLVEQINPLGAKPAEAAEMDQVGGRQPMATQAQTTSGQAGTPGTYTPGTPASKAGSTFVPATPGYRDDIVPDRTDRGPVSGKTRWVRTWDDGRTESWRNESTAGAESWIALPTTKDPEAEKEWDRQHDNDLNDFAKNNAANRTAGVAGHSLQKAQTTNAQGQPIIRTSAVQIDAQGNVTVTPLPQLDEPVPVGKKNYISGPRGELFEIDPQTGNLSLAEAAAPQVTTINGVAGTIDQSGAFKPVLGAPGQPPTIHIAGNRVVVVNPQTGAIASNTIIDPAQQAQEQAAAAQQAQIRALQIQKAQQDLIPAQSLIIKNHYALIDDLQRRVQSGEMTPDQADSYYQANQSYTLAALQGSTPLQIAQEKRQAEDARRRAGIDVLNQRVATGGTLASNLLSAASGLAQKAIFRPGQTSFGVDPLALARAFATGTVNDLGGGQGMSDFAKNLVMGGAPSPAGLGESDAAGLFTPPWRQTPGGAPMSPGSGVGAPVPSSGAPQAPMAPQAPRPGQQWYPPIPYGAPQA